MYDEYIYKIETHCHTADFSPCGRMPAAELVERYHEAGYSALALTDHVRLDRGQFTPENFEKDMSSFLGAYEKTCEAAEKYGMKIYFGAEIMFNATKPDEFLLIGADETFIRETIPMLDKITPLEYRSFAKERGVLFFQAHPYREKCTPVEKEAVDGVEVYNSHPGHSSRNGLAIQLGKDYGCMTLTGSDAHCPDHVALSGIRTKTVPENTEEYKKLILSQDFIRIGENGNDLFL